MSQTTATASQIEKFDITEKFKKHLIPNSGYISSAIMMSIMKKLTALKFPKDITDVVRGVQAITGDDGKKMYIADDIGQIVSLITLAEMGWENGAPAPAPVAPVIAESNIYPIANTATDTVVEMDKKIATAIADEDIIITGTTMTATPDDDSSSDEESDEEEPVGTSTTTKKEPLPRITSIRLEVFPNVGTKTVSEVALSVDMDESERSQKVISLCANLFIGGLSGGKFSVKWSNGNTISDNIDPANIDASVAFVLNMQEVENRNILANN